MYIVKLADGTELKNLGLNGDNFVSKTKIEDSVFEGNLSTVEITDIETKEKTVLKDAELLLNRQYGEEYWFVVREKTPGDKAMEQIENDITNVQEAIVEIYEMMLGGM